MGRKIGKRRVEDRDVAQSKNIFKKPCGKLLVCNFIETII